LSHESEIACLNVDHARLRGIVGNADELAAPFAGHVFNHPLLRLADPNYARLPGAVELQLAIRKRVSMPEELPVLVDSNDVSSVALNVKMTFDSVSL
jgi:hypothetical protein